jgi:hypothetical protein
MLLNINTNTLNATKRPTGRLSSFGLDERKLQDILFKSLDRLFPDDELILLMQSRQWQEEPDLMAIDKEGNLFIFELKAWESHYENLLQVLRYGQMYGAMKYPELDGWFKKVTDQSQSLKVAHKSKFDVELSEEEFNRKQVFVVMTNGMDYRTREAVQYWRSCKLDVRPWVYRIYAGDTTDEMLLEMPPFRVADNPYEDIAGGFYMLNTNYGNSPEDHEEMLRNRKAAAYFDPWKFKIERLERGDVVFLYQVGVGIVAYGRVAGKLIKAPYHGNPEEQDEEYSKKLDPFKLLAPPLSAEEIRRITGTNHSFRGTMFALDAVSGEKLKLAIDNRIYADGLPNTMMIPTKEDILPPPISVPDDVSWNNVIIAMKKAIRRETGNKPLSIFTIGCLTGELYHLYRGVVIPVTITSVTQQKFEDDLKQLADFLKHMKPPVTLIFAAGGTLELPGWFRELCAALGMTIIMLESEHQIPEVIRLLSPRPVAVVRQEE